MTDRRARLRSATAAVVLLVVAAAALALLRPEPAPEVDHSRVSRTPATTGAAAPAGSRPLPLDDGARAAADDDGGDAPGGTSAAAPRAGPDDSDEDAAPAAPGDVAATGRLTGRVMGPGDGVVTGVVVVARPIPHHDGRALLRFDADALGRFDAVVPASEYHVFAEVPDHVSAEPMYADVPASGVTDVTITLRRARSTLRGRVLGPGDVPIAGVRVEAGGRAMGEKGAAVSGADGAFTIGGLPESVYQVDTEAAGYLRDRVEVAVTDADGGEVTIRLEVGGRLAGMVRDPTGAPAAGATVIANGERERVAATSTDAQGRFDLGLLPPGQVSLFASSKDVTLSAGAVVDVLAGALVVRDLTLAPGHTLSGRLTDAGGAPVIGMHVIARGPGLREARTDEDGRYAIEHLSPGRYVVLLARDGLRGRSTRERQVAEVDVTGSIALDLVAPPGANVAGSVVSDDGRPLAKARVVAVLGGDVRGSTSADADGGFRLQDLPPGRYRLFASEADALVGHADQDLTDGAAVTGVRIVLHPPARARGRVLDPEGRPVQGLELVLRRLDSHAQCASQTDAEGRFELFPLDDGEHELEASSRTLLLTATRLGAARATLATRRVEIAQGRDVVVDLRVALE